MQPSPNSAANVSPSTKASPLRKGCFGCLGLILCGLLVVLLFSEFSEKDVSHLPFDEQISHFAGIAFQPNPELNITPQVDGGYAVHAKWKVGTSWSNESARKGIFMHIHSFFSRLAKTGAGSQVVRYWFDPQIEVSDGYGVKSVVPGAKVIIPRETINRIQWDNFNWKMLMELAESEGLVTWHPAMVKHN